MKSRYSLIEVLGVITLVAVLLLGCDSQDQNLVDQGSSPGGVNSSQSRNTSPRNGFAAQSPVDLSHNGILVSIDGRIMAKLDEVHSEAAFIGESESQPTQLKMLLLDHPEPQNREESDELDNLISKIRTFLSEKVLIPENIVEELPNSVTYRIDGPTLCDNEANDGNNDPMDIQRRRQERDDCIRMIGALDLRMRFSSPEPDTMKVEALVGPNSQVPFTVSASSSDLEITIDAAPIPEALSILAQQAANPQQLSFPQQWHGTLVVSLSKVGERSYEVKAEAAQGIIASMLLDGQKFGLDLKISKNLGSVIFNAEERSVVGRIEMNGVDATAPLIMLLDEQDLTPEIRAIAKNLDLHIEKISGSAKVIPELDYAAFTDIQVSAEPYTLKHDGENVLELNFPKVQKLSATFKKIAGVQSLEFSSGLSIAIKSQLKKIEAMIGKIPGSFGDEEVNFDLEGIKPLLTFKEQSVQLSRGEAIISSRAAGRSVAVHQGQCLEVVKGDVQFWIEILHVYDCQ